MRKKTFKCPSCKKKNKLDKSQDFGFCIYCGTRIQIKKGRDISPQEFVGSPVNKQPVKKPWYKKWWIWVIIGVAVCSVGTIISGALKNASKRTDFDLWEMELISELETETTTEKETGETTEEEMETSTKAEEETTTEAETTTTPVVPAIAKVEGFNTLQSLFLSIEDDWTMDYVKNISEASGLYAFIDEGEESDSGVIFTKCIQVAEAPYIDINYGSEKYEFDGDYIWLVYRHEKNGSYSLKTGDYVIESNGIRVGLGGALSRGITGTVPDPDPDVDTLPEHLRYALDMPRFNGGNW